MSAVIKPPAMRSTRSEDCDVVRTDLQRKNARNTGAWWSRFAGGVHCPDLRDDELRSRGRLIAVRMQSATIAVMTMRVLREIDAAVAALRRASNVVPFKRQAG